MKPTGYLIMGVSGSGKTAVGKALARRLGWEFLDADDFHPPANIAKMRAGIPLDDADREPWLAALHDRLSSVLAAGGHPVLACSALKEKYRRQLLEGNRGILIVFLKGDYDLIWERMIRRRGRFMRPEMLRSQFEALEEPRGALVVAIDRPVAVIVRQIIAGSR